MTRGVPKNRLGGGHNGVRSDRDGRNDYLCEYVNRVTVSMQVEDHSDVSGSETTASGRSYECPDCRKVFKKPAHLKEHVRTHTGEVRKLPLRWKSETFLFLSPAL